MSSLRLAIIGCGEWSSRMHLPALGKLARTQDVGFVAVCDLEKERAETYARQLAQRAGQAEVPAVHSDLKKMLEACRPDGVLVLVGPAAASAVIGVVAEKGVAFLTEKPPAAYSAAHRCLIDQVKDLPHVVGYNRRHAPYIQQAIRWLANAQVQCVTCLFSRCRRREADFTTTAVHAIDTVRYLAGAAFTRLRIDAAPAGQAVSYFVNGWADNGARIDILMTPDTASAVEHYIVRSQERTGFVSFPQVGMMDVPGFVELHEENKVVARMTPADFGIESDDFPTLGGILAEQTLFCQALRGQAKPIATLANTLQTQLVREALSRLLAEGGRGTIDMDFEE